MSARLSGRLQSLGHRRDGRVVEIDGSHANPATRGYICAKVRRFGERVYGDSRVRFPMVRTGHKGSGTFARVTWDEAIEAVAQAIERTRERSGAESILPFCYGGSNGLLTQDNTDAAFFRQLGASRLLRTVCAAPTGAANMGLYGKMPSVTYLDYPHARLIVMWGMNPSASGIHAIPFIKEAQKAGARWSSIDPRVTPLAKTADLHLAVRPGTDLVVALALHRVLFEEGHADRRVPRRARHRRRRAARARRGVDHRARGRGRRASIRPTCAGSRTCTRARARPWCAAAGAWSATATAAAPWRPSWRCRPSAASSACAAAAMR